MCSEEVDCTDISRRGNKEFTGYIYDTVFMNRLNQTEPATFSILPCWAFFKDSIFIYFRRIVGKTFSAKVLIPPSVRSCHLGDLLFQN
jgi:hypothetical protein